MTINQFVNDTIEVTNYLRERFQQDKIYLIGHSWGTILGLLAVQKAPQLFHRYFGVAQFANYHEGEQLSYNYILEKAKAENKKAFEVLSNIGSPPWSNFKHERVHQKYLEAFGAGISHDGKLLKKYVKDILTSGEYTWLDIINLLRGQLFSYKHLQDEMKKINFNKDIQKIEVPIYFCTGRHDLMIPFEPSYDFYNNLEAPEKHWIWFEDSAHSPLIEEKDKFLSLLIGETNKDLQ
jgi:pimeloyl-ACP methyl ester carboxylesterase